MPLKPSDVRIPPERISARVRSRPSTVLGDSQKSAPTLVRPTTNKARVSAQTILSNAPSRLVEPKEEDDNDEDIEPSGSESDDDDTVFKSRSKLPASSVQRWKLAELTERIDTGWIDLDPEYQRDIVWNPKAMSGLINSLIEDYYIPPIIFNLKEEVDGDESRQHRRVCVDGKQRLSSVHAFMRGTIPCTDRHGKAWYYCASLDDDGKPLRGHHRRRIWSEQLQQEFRNKSFVSYEFKGLTRVQEEDLFARVQKGMPLTAAEKLHAASGPWQDLAKQYEQDFSPVVNLSVSNRSTGFRNILTAMTQITEIQNPSNSNGTPQTKIQMPSIHRMCSQYQHLCDGATKAHLHAVFTKFQHLAEINPKTFQNNGYKVARNFAPVEIVAVAVLISEYFGARNDHMLLGDIETMRQTIREHLPDLRMDNVTWKTIWQFISELESFRGAADGLNVLKKTFTPKRVTDREISRVNQSQRPSLREVVELGVKPPTRIAISRPATASTEQSVRSTPLFTPTSPVSSSSSPNAIAINPAEQENGSRVRSASVDSVFGENLGDQESVNTMKAPSWAPVTPMVSGPLPHRYIMHHPVTTTVKSENPSENLSSHKRPFSTGNTGFAPGARALQAKRRKFSKSVAIEP